MFYNMHVLVHEYESQLTMSNYKQATELVAHGH